MSVFKKIGILNILIFIFFVSISMADEKGDLIKSQSLNTEQEFPTVELPTTNPAPTSPNSNKGPESQGQDSVIKKRKDNGCNLSNKTNVNINSEYERKLLSPNPKL